MDVHLEVVVANGVADDLSAACRKFGLDRDLFIQRAIEEKLERLADDGANWRDTPHERSVTAARRRFDEEE